MCWSANADLAAGSVIAVIGAGCLAGVRRPRDIPLASLPLILGAHQIIESFVWRGQESEVSASTASAARTAWAIIALPLLPLLVPWAVLLASATASKATRRRLWALSLVGTATSAILAATLIAHPVTARVLGHTLGYSADVPVVMLVVVGYLAATLGSLLLADDPIIRLFGAVSTVGAGICYLLWELAFASTWCALAAVTSLILLYWVWSPRPGVMPAR